MTKPRNSKTNIQDQLADYTDRILARKAVNQDKATFAPDPHLRALEKTALRLKNAFGNDLDEATIQRMHYNIVRGWHQDEIKASQPFWQKWMQAFKPSEPKWQSRQSRQRFSMALSLATLIVLMLIGIPFLNISGSNQPGASGQNLNAIILAAFGGLILLVLWLYRRKP